jgi:hypothetical protein
MAPIKRKLSLIGRKIKMKSSLTDVDYIKVTNVNVKSLIASRTQIKHKRKTITSYH